MKVLFWGTPDFALPSLRALGEEGHQVVGVVTQPDRPAGRGRSLRAPPVRVLAEEEGYPVFQPERPTGEDFLSAVRALDADISVVVAYGHILQDEVLTLNPHGAVNVHASLLPELRGAAPVHWAIIRGHRLTGVTIMRVVRELDAGPILHQVEEPILGDDTVTELTDRLSELGAEALVQALALMSAGALEEREQNDDEATYAPKIHREMARVEWASGARTISNHIRGMDAVPGAWTLFGDEPVKLYAASAGPERIHESEPGTVVEAGDDGLWVAAGEGAVCIREVQPAGKRRMLAAQWILGREEIVGRRFD